MLKQRLITALILGALMVWGVLSLSTEWFAAGLLIIILPAAWEWSGLSNVSGPVGRTIYCLIVLALLASLWWLPENRLWLILIPAGFFWCYVLLWLWRYAARPETHDPMLARQLSGLMVLTAPFAALLVLHGETAFGRAYVLFLLSMIWVADSVAYFAGRRWGRTKLAPGISPGKTREGVYGALTAALVFALIGALILDLAPSQWPWFMLVCALTVLFSIVGDLFESMIKRQHGAKDSGTLLPGHGGILDRVDSMTAAAPIFALGIRGLLA